MRRAQQQRATRASSPYVFVALLVAFCPREVAAQATAEPQTIPQTQLPAAPPGPTSKRGLGYWFNPVTSPFLPLPLIAVDPNSGPTYGLLPVWLKTDANHDIRQIIAPDLIYNNYFGYGAHARLYVYPSPDEQWSVSAGLSERVERSFFGQFQKGLLRDTRWSTWISLVYDRDGTARFYGIGNDSPISNQTNYTNQQAMLQGQFGLNLTHAWQLQYTARLRNVDVLPGTLPGIPSIEVLFPQIPGLGTTNAFLNRLAVVYDTRDDVTVPGRADLPRTARFAVCWSDLAQGLRSMRCATIPSSLHHTATAPPSSVATTLGAAHTCDIDTLRLSRSMARDQSPPEKR